MKESENNRMTETKATTTAKGTSGRRADTQGAPRTEGRERPQRRVRRDRQPRARSEFDNKILAIRRVTRVVAGGRRFSFSVAIAIGNGRGQVGVGLGKASDTALAIEKATRDAKKHLVRVPMTDGHSIPHEVDYKYAASHVLLIPAPGKGLKAGSAVRTVLELAGLRHVSGKILSRSKNHLNNARATTHALAALRAGRKRKPKAEAAPEAA